MEELTDTIWDVVIAGTGLPQSLLALALSRSDKKVLHVDRRSYYGGSEAAFSLQEAEDWVKAIASEPDSFPFESASIHTPSPPTGESSLLSPSRAYTLSLSPNLIYSRSRLLPNLISSKVYRQLEFQAVGSWWICRSGDDDNSKPANISRVPGSREDIFADEAMSNKSKRTLMKFLRYLAQPPEEDATQDGELDTSFAPFMESKFQISSDLYDPLLSLSLSPHTPQDTACRYAIPNIKRHLASIGVFGPGFGSVLAKWGGGSEIAQVGCRACAVGGGVYVLNRGIKEIKLPDGVAAGDNDGLIKVQLSDGETVQSRHVAGSLWDLPRESRSQTLPSLDKVARSITIVSSPLASLFPPTSEGGAIPAGAVVMFPGPTVATGNESVAPVYLIVHSGDTGECPAEQCVIYGSVALPGETGQALIERAVNNLLSSIDEGAKVLWTLRYTQLGRLDNGNVSETVGITGGQVLAFPPPSLDLAFDDSMIDQVKTVWKKITGDQAEESDFMQFEDREAAHEEDAR